GLLRSDQFADCRKNSRARNHASCISSSRFSPAPVCWSLLSVLRVAKQLPLGLPSGCFLYPLAPLAPPPLLLLPYFVVYRQPICPSITMSLSSSKIETGQRLMHAQGQQALSQASTGMIVRASRAIHDDESKMLVLQSSSFTTKGLSEYVFSLSSTSFQISISVPPTCVIIVSIFCGHVEWVDKIVRGTFHVISSSLLWLLAAWCSHNYMPYK
ncbi:unnamed protein product, partial [Musa acuminata subsp. burmannicoides]